MSENRRIDMRRVIGEVVETAAPVYGRGHGDEEIVEYVITAESYKELVELFGVLVREDNG